MNEPYSRPLSAAAKAALIDFIAAYIESMKTSAADAVAEAAKAKAVACLATDIDILVFVAAINCLYAPRGIDSLLDGVQGGISARDAAVAIVRITQEAVRIDKQQRTS